MTLQSIKKGSKGEAVEAWQYFLLGLGYFKGTVDGDFGGVTHTATVVFQKSAGLTGDGWVARDTYAAAMARGFNPVQDDVDSGKSPFPALTVAEKHKRFGQILFESAPTTSDPEAVKITNGWEKNITYVAIPQLEGVYGAGKSTAFPFHKAIAMQVQALFKAWEDAGLKPLILSYAGSWVPRYVRGSRTSLSSHAWGTAFDINAPQNMRGQRPALIGEKGSVRDLVPIAHKHGFFWGGHFSKEDGMHFEAALVTPRPDILELDKLK